MAGLKQFVNSLIDKKLKPVNDEISIVSTEVDTIADIVDEDHEKIKGFYVIAADGEIDATSATITVGEQTVILKVGDMVYKPDISTPELWLCVDVIETGTTNVQITLS